MLGGIRLRLYTGRCGAITATAMELLSLTSVERDNTYFCMCLG